MSAAVVRARSESGPGMVRARTASKPAPRQQRSERSGLRLTQCACVSARVLEEGVAKQPDLPDQARADAALTAVAGRTTPGPWSGHARTTPRTKRQPMRARDAMKMVDLMRFITAAAPVLDLEAGSPSSAALAPVGHSPGRGAAEEKAPAVAGGQPSAGTPADEVRAFVRARCVLDPRLWSYRQELWTAYAAWAGPCRLCRDRHELEAPLLAARVAAIGMTGEIIAGVGLKEHWPAPKTRRKGGQKA